jgi:argininosuccinate lyase
MQEDKEAVFDSFDTARESIAISRIVLQSIKLDSKKMLAAATNGFLNATELADYLVGKGVAFRESHEIVGKLVLFALKTSRELSDLTLSEMKKFSPTIGKDVYDALSLEATLKNKRSIGGTSPQTVKSRIAQLMKKSNK